MPNLVDAIIDDTAKALIRTSISEFLAVEVKKGMISATQAAYITEGAVDAVQLAFNEFAAAKKPA